MSESEIQSKIRIALSAHTHGIVLRLNAGEFWQGKTVYSNEFHQNILINIRRVSGLPIGCPDLLHVGPDGRTVWLEIETATGRASKDQVRFIERLRSMGHRAGIARDVKEALELITTMPNERKEGKHEVPV